MPGSMPEGKQFIKNFLISNDVTSILDVGPGSGNYVDLLKGVGEYANYPGGTRNNVRWEAVEIFEPYIEIFNLRNKYNFIYTSDIYDLIWIRRYDAVILGDVLEHMSYSRAVEVIKQATDHANWVILSLPIIDFPQESSWGNEHEAHVEQYSPERVRDLLAGYEIVAYYEGEVIGSYIFRKKS